MAIDTTPAADSMLARIDAIMHELAELRRQIEEQQQLPKEGQPGLARQLYGSLGQGKWDEWERDLDWQRFDT